MIFKKKLIIKIILITINFIIYPSQNRPYISNIEKKEKFTKEMTPLLPTDIHKIIIEYLSNWTLEKLQEGPPDTKYASYSSDGNYLSFFCADDGKSYEKLYIIDTKNGKLMCINDASLISHSTDSKYICFLNSLLNRYKTKKVAINKLDINKGQLLQELLSVDFRLEKDYCPNEEKIILWDAESSKIILWNVKTNTEINTLTHIEHPIVSIIKFSYDRNYIFIAHQKINRRNEKGILEIWDSNLNKKILDIEDKNFFSSLAYSSAFTRTPKHNLEAQGNNFIAGGFANGEVKIWDINTGKLIHSLSSTKYIQALAYSPDGKYLASGSNDGYINIWHSDTARELKSFHYERSLVISLSFANNQILIAVLHHKEYNSYITKSFIAKFHYGLSDF